MPVTIKALTEVAEEIIGSRPWKEFRRQLYLEVVLSHRTRRIQYHHLRLRGTRNSEEVGQFPVVWDPEQGTLLCRALREALRGKLGNGIVAANVIPVEGRGVGCHWEGIIPLGSVVGPMMAKVGNGGIRLISWTTRRCGVPTGPIPTYIAPWQKQPVRT